MRIAEASQVRRHYPNASDDAIAHVLWCLHQALPYIESGDDLHAYASLHGDLAHWEGSMDELKVFGIPEICAALPVSPVVVADTLDRYHLLHRPLPGPRGVV